MNSCAIKVGFFNPSLDTSDLAYAISRKYREVKAQSTADGIAFSTTQFYSALLEHLKSENTPYKVEYSLDFKDSEKKMYKQSLMNLKETILMSIPDTYKRDIKMTELRALLDELMPQDLNASRLRGLNNPSSDSFVIERVEVEEESDIPKEVTFRQYLTDTYGTCFGAIKLMKNSFARDIFNYSIIDFEKGRYITNSVELNENIAVYKNKLFNTIVRFLQSKNPSIQYSDTMYLPSMFVSSNYSVLMANMEEHLSSIDSKTVVNDDYAAVLSGTASLELDAINAYTTLKYFDSLLLETLGKTIAFSPVYKNQEVGITTYKYQFKKDSEHQRKSWSDSENRSAALNTARFSKFVLDSIPLIINGKVQDRNVGVMLFNVTLTKLFANITELSRNNDPNVKLLVNYVRLFHNSPIVFAHKIHQLISENSTVQSALRTYLKFNDLDIGTIQSIYKYLLSYDEDLVLLKNWDNVRKKSVRAVEFNTLRTSYSLGKYSILNDLVGVMDDCMDATYFYTRYNFNGSIETLKRVKFKTRRGSEKFKNTLNAANSSYSLSFRELLKAGCQVIFPTANSTLSAIIRIPLNISDNLDVLEFKINSSGTLGILEQSNTVEISVSQKPEILLRVYELFSKESPIDISSVTSRNRLLSEDSTLTEDELLYKSVLRFLDDRLKTKFLTPDGLEKLNIYHGLQTNSSTEPYIGDLLLYAAKSLIVSDIYYDFEEARRTSPDIKSRRDFGKFLRKRYRAFSNLTPDQKRTYFLTVNGVDMLLTLPSSTQWVDVYDYATLVLQGDASSSVSKNLSGNNDANYVTAFLGGLIHNLTYNANVAMLERAKLLASDPTIPLTAASALLFTKHPLLVKQAVINSDVANRNGDVKNVRDLKQSELFYNAIIHNFWTSFINTGEYCIQPTTYSDKVKLILYLIDGQNYKHFNGKSLSQLTPLEIVSYYALSIGESSKLAMDNILYTYKKLWGEDLTLELINVRLKSYDESKLIEEAAAKGINMQLDFHYRVKKSGGRSFLSINEVIPYLARYADQKILSLKLETEKVNFVNNLIDSGVLFYTDYHDTSLYDNKFRNLTPKEQLSKSNSPVAKIILSLYTTNEELYEFLDKWVLGGKLIFAYNSAGEAVTYKNTLDVVELNPLLEKFFYLDSLLSNNLRFLLTGFETNHPDKSKFAKMWGAEVKNIKNELINCTTVLDKKGNPKRDANINKLLNAKIVWTNLAVEGYEGSNIVVLPAIPANLDVVINAPENKGKTIIISSVNPDEALLVTSLDSKQLHTIALDNTGTIESAVQIGNIDFKDVMALANGLDLLALQQSSNANLRQVANNLTEVVQNISQGTQLKRNVIVPATMHYMHGDFINGVSRNIKVAIIKDVGAKVFNFDGGNGVIDSMDGSAFINAFESILENKTLGSQEVGADKKPIWHHYDLDSATAALMKFATFEINNARMKASLGSRIPLHRMFKKMTNMQWANLDENGQPISWNTSHPVTLGMTTRLTSIRRTPQPLNFANDILEGNPLYYKMYDANGELHYKLITDFGHDENGYYTVELYVDELGDLDWMMNDDVEKVYHYFDSESNHHTTKLAGDHTINSLYELWQTLGGMESQSLNDDGWMSDSESSNYAVVGFMNTTIVPKQGTTDRMDITLNSYDQPLKEMMIGYLTNNSAMKNGTINRNSDKRWFDNEPLAFMTMDSRNLGIQMDADHDVEEAAEMTEFSQVISALESGGALHNYAKQVYYDLGKVAAISSSIEIDTLADYLAGEDNNYAEVKSLLYDLIGRTLLNGIKSREDLASLTDDILRLIEKRFNRNIDHISDAIKIPLSDANIYSQIIPTVVSIINRKSIKRKYPGSGCVMIPGFDIMQYYTLNGKRYMFNDLVKKASEWMLLNGLSIPEDIPDNSRLKYMVDTYLDTLQADPSLLRDSVNDFIPTDIVDVVCGDKVVTINLDGLDEYYNFKDLKWDKFGIDPASIMGFRYNIKLPKNLAPVRITFELSSSGRKMNVFDLDVFREAYRNLSPANTEKVQEAFRLLKEGYVRINGELVGIRNLKNMPAELIISNMYSKVFGTGSMSVAEIKEKGPEAFTKQYRAHAPSTNYDMVFDGSDPTYITFTSPKGKTGNKYIPYKKSNLYSEKDSNGNINVYLLSDDNRKLFKVGRYIVRPKYSYSNGEYFDENNKPIPSKLTTNFKREGSTVYEYIEFVSLYKVTEKRLTADGGVADIDTYDKYYINMHNLNAVFNREDSEASKKLYKAFIIGLLDDIYSTKLFEGISFNSDLSQAAAGNIVRYVANMLNVDNDFRLDVLIPIEQYLRGKLNEFVELKVTNGSISMADNIGGFYLTYYDKLAVLKYNSWQLSLYFTAARIPAQTLQSFMQMEAIAYTGNTSNLVFVSHWQAWLQGSDY